MAVIVNTACFSGCDAV